MLHDQIATAIQAAKCTRTLDDLARSVWRAAAAGAIGEDAAGELGIAVETRRRALRRPAEPRRGPVRDKADLLARRRRCAASGALPPQIACLFTPGQIATLSIIVLEIRQHGRCDLYLDAIAARAGVSRSLAKDAIREAKRLRILNVEERRRPRLRSLSNVITIASPELALWVARGRGQKGDSDQYKSIQNGFRKTKHRTPEAEKKCMEATKEERKKSFNFNIISEIDKGT